MTSTLSTNQIGSLHSNARLVIHSRFANAIWKGRERVMENGKTVKYGILSMPAALSILSKIQNDAANDDPIADYFLIQFENRVTEAGAEMKRLITEIVDLYASQIPENMTIDHATNNTPVEYQLYINAQLGYKLVYLLADFDTLMRAVRTCKHIALLTSTKAFEWEHKSSALIRRCFTPLMRYRRTGITRQDAIEKNARYLEAIKRVRLDRLPRAVILGEKRADFAPTIRNASVSAEELKKAGNRLEDNQETAPVDNTPTTPEAGSVSNEV